MKKQIAIRAVGLSKEYRLGAIGPSNSAAGVMDWWRRIRGVDLQGDARGDGASVAPLSKRQKFLALDDVSFDLLQGEALGIIGANGSGKSTLLKLISRVTLPSQGKLFVRGRLLSMLEVGTGFHPDLTGRENVYMNGMLIGMGKREVQQRFDEIVEFAEVGQFIDTPVKRYSSGMHMRLAFSVAAHFVPEIIIIDEVLSVGDARFQRKCLDKMAAVLQQGRTILFVSHNMATVASFCSKGLVLNKGRSVFFGSVADAIHHYDEMQNPSGGVTSVEYDDGEGGTSEGASKPRIVGDDYAHLISAAILTSEHQKVSEVRMQDAVIVQMRYRILERRSTVALPYFQFTRMDNTTAFIWRPAGVKPHEPGEYEVECRIPPHFLNDGVYYIHLNLCTYNDDGTTTFHYQEARALTFSVMEDFEDLQRFRYGYKGIVYGTVRPTELLGNHWRRIGD